MAPTPAHTRRPSPARPEGNARLTGGLAAVLLVLLAAEGVTVLRVGQLLTWHVVIGLVLVPPIAAKIGSTLWRFARYYLGDADYRLKGPPALLLRLLGPLMITLTVVLFGSGIALLLAPVGWTGRLLEIHKVSFVLWFAVTAVHVLGHLVETGRLAPQDWLPAGRRRIRGAGARRAVLVGSVALGAVLAVALAGHVGTYRHAHHLGNPGVQPAGELR